METKMDLTKLVERLQKHPRQNVILSYEDGQTVQRTHADVHRDVKGACVLLRTWGVEPGMRVGIRAPNCYQWLIYDLALIELRAISVAFTDDFADKTARELLEQYNLSLVLVPATEKVRNSDRQGAVAFIDGPNSGVMAIRYAPERPDPDFTKPGLVFSSGSSGQRKGLILNRKGIEASVDAFTQAVRPRHDDCLLLFLPISNFQQRLMYYSALWYGFDLIVADPGKLFRALKDLRPTMLIAPPMLYETIETRFRNLPEWKQSAAMRIGTVLGKLPFRALRKRIAQAVFRDIYEALGGRVWFLVTGMAPIKRSTLELFRAMQLPLFETYGLTEFGSISLNVPGAYKIGSVGKLLPGVNVELAPDGEIIAVREHSIASGYFEGADSSQQTFVGTNRIATGDIGRLDEQGYLHLIGRKKEIILTTGGEKLHPETLESEIQACPEIAKAVVFQSADDNALTAVILPRKFENYEARQKISQFIAEIGEQRPAAAIRSVVFTDTAFSRENGFLLPNLKLNRRKIASHFSPINSIEPELQFITRSA